MTERELDRLAELIADRLTDRPPAPRRVVTVAELAAELRVSRDAIYDDADRLGAFRVGQTLRFDLDDALARSRRPLAPTADPSPPTRPRRRRRTSAGVPLLPINERTR
jgi:hypothetical protein